MTDHLESTSRTGCGHALPDATTGGEAAARHDSEPVSWPGASPPDRLLTADEVAALLCVPTRWVREHSRSGLLPSVKLGRYVRYRRETVLDWVETQETGGAAWRKHHPVPGTGTK